jgi:hypothetical protein
MAGEWLERFRSLLEAPAPAVLTTYRENGEAASSPVWFRWFGGAFEVVIAEGDPKLQRLEADPTCSLLVFEAVPPFRGVQVSGQAVIAPGDVSEARAAIAGLYLGHDDGRRFAEARKSKPGVLVRLMPSTPRVWDLAAMLPSGLSVK